MKPAAERPRQNVSLGRDYRSRGSHVLTCLMPPPPYQALGGSVTELRVSASVEAGGMAQGSANLALIGCQLRGSTFTTLIWKRISPNAASVPRGGRLTTPLRTTLAGALLIHTAVDCRVQAIYAHACPSAGAVVLLDLSPIGRYRLDYAASGGISS